MKSDNGKAYGIDYSEHYEVYRKRLPEAAERLALLGVVPAMLQKYGVGYTEDPETARGGESVESVILPVSPYSYSIHYPNGQATSHIGRAELFNAAMLDQMEPVYIVDEVVDALRVESHGGKALALNGTRGKDFLISAAEERTALPPMILAVKDDGLADELRKHAAIIYAMRLPEGIGALAFEIPLAEAQARIELERRADVMREEQARRCAEYQDTYGMRAYSADFLELVRKESSTPPIPTGYRQLDEILDGGLFPGLYIMGAINSLGKTTFVLQMADKIAATGHDVMIFSLEMSRFELLCKSISRLTYMQAKDKSKAKNTRHIMNGSLYSSYRPDELEAITNAADLYKLTADHRIIIEGNGTIGVSDIRQAVERHEEMTGNKPVVVIDYLQILKPEHVQASDKQNTDRAVSELKRISRDERIPVIAISSFNRDNYNQGANAAAFKESGAIEYAADVLIALQVRGVDSYKQTPSAKTGNNKTTRGAMSETRREIELIILKNRNGRMGMEIAYDFYTPYNYFTETTYTD